MDYIKRFTTREGVRMSLAVTTDTVETARVRHDLWPVATAALGRAMTGAILLAGDFKNHENVSLRIKGDGPLGVVHVDAFADNTVRGYVDEPHVDVPLKRAGKLDVGAAVGHTSPIQSGEVAEDLAYYLYASEQVPSTISLGVLVDPDYHTVVAGGFIVQALPDATDEALAQVEKNINELGPITEYLKANPDGKGLMERVLDGLTVNEVYNEPIHFQCRCGRDRFGAVLMTLREEDKEAILEDEVTELVCHYCNEKYHFTREELQDMFAPKGPIQ
ncbi:MAG: Hsp33 family molecular chaperone HslO [Veillonella sp.]|nr:Hsp33 family molecular chaperone HslO [Veillonella sp.]